MKASKLIQELARFIAEYEDREVVFDGSTKEAYCEDTFSTLSLSYAEGYIRIYGEEL